MHYSLRVSRREQERIPLLLRSVGIEHLQEAIRRPNGFPVWQIFYGVSGKGVFYLDGFRTVMQPGQIAVLPPNTRHGYESLDSDWVVHYLGFDGPLCLRILSVLKLSEAGVYSLPNPALFLHALARIQELAAEEKCRQELCSRELYSLLLDLSATLRRLPANLSKESDGPEKELILYLEDHYAEDISLATLSEHFYLTSEYLCAIFKRSTGESIMRYLRKVRIHHAKLLLMEKPEQSIESIAQDCGFHSSAYFGRVFREVAGCTPQQYRMGTGSGSRL